MGYARAPIIDFEAYLRLVVRLDGDDIQQISKTYSSNVVNYEISPGKYSFNDISEVAYTMGGFIKELYKMNVLI